jgi:hypothetical protein
MQTTKEAQLLASQRLAYVVDAHNVGCLVRFVGESSTQRAQYSEAIQQHGVVIRSGHLVIVDESSSPLQVIWRLGTIGAVESLALGMLTLDLGYRSITIPFQDQRQPGERRRQPAAGDRVLLRGSPLEQATVVDVLTDGELSHPERLLAAALDVIGKRNVVQ